MSDEAPNQQESQEVKDPNAINLRVVSQVRPFIYLQFFETMQNC